MECEAFQEQQQQQQQQNDSAAKEEPPSTSNDTRKRRHPNSADINVVTDNRLSAAEILERIETPNFEELARQYPAFRQAWQATRQQQLAKHGLEQHATFSACVTQEFTIALTRALLQTYFSLKLPYLEEHHLCPPIPNRFFYVQWIHTKLLSENEGSAATATSSSALGLDIGSGASCIYPLLAARHFRSTMVATEIDVQAAALARSNVQANHLLNFIAILDVEPSDSQQRHSAISPSAPSRPGGPLARAIEAMASPNNNKGDKTGIAVQPLQFVMTNPPFYDPSSDEHIVARAGDGRARTNMTVSEGTYPGGEVGFVVDLLEDSLRLTTTAATERDDNSSNNPFLSATTWYSSMLGKKTSLLKLHKILVHLLGPGHVRTVEYGPGHYTRWFLAWTLQQPNAKSPHARCPPHDNDMWDLSLATLMEQEPNRVANAVEAMQEIVRRVVSFCESSPGGWDLMAQVMPNTQEEDGDELVMVQIQETMPPAIDKFVDETQKDEFEMPLAILDALDGRDNNNFLPEEGHFLVQLCVRHERNGNGVDCFRLQLELFKHSARGGKAVEKIRNCIEGEVCRANRKWRKIRERERQREQ